MNEALDNLVMKVSACQEACNICFDACLQEEDVAMMAECIRTDRQCADACGIVLNFAYRKSDIFPDLVAACAKACAICADECESHDHEHCKICAKACRECEEACKEFLAN